MDVPDLALGGPGDLEAAVPATMTVMCIPLGPRRRVGVSPQVLV